MSQPIDLSKTPEFAIEEARNRGGSMPLVPFTITFNYNADDGEHLMGVAAVFADIVAEQDGVDRAKVYVEDNLLAESWQEDREED